MSITNSTDAQVGGVYRQAEATTQNLKGSGMNLPELMMAILMERSNILQNQVQDQMKDMQKRNEWLRDANAALAALRTARPTDASGTVSADQLKNITFTDTSGKTVNALEWAQANKIETGLDYAGIAEAERAKTAMDNFMKNVQPGKVYTYPTFTDRNGNTVQINRWGEDTKKYQSFDRGNQDNIFVQDEGQMLQARINNDLQNGVGGMTQSKFDAAIQNFKAAIDTANTNSQLDMVRLQGLMDKFNQNNDLLSNSLAKNAKPIDTITGNIRG
jgi:hypothetical protein